MAVIMDYTVNRFQKAERIPIPLEARKLFASDRFEVVHLSLKPGEGMDLHEMPFPVVFVVSMGDGILQAGEEKIPASRGDCIRVEPGVMRGWRNEGNAVVDIIVMKLIR